MNENITIQHLRNINLADLNGFKDVIGDTLREQGSSPAIQSAPVSPFKLDGGVVRIIWTGKFDFCTPDGAHQFGSELLAVEVTTDQLDHMLMVKLMAARSAKLEEGYRHALRGIYNLAADMRDGRMEKPADPLDYLTQTLEAAVNAFPKAN